MKFSLGLIFLMSIFMLGCGSTSSQETKSSTESSKFLTIKKGPLSGTPVAIDKMFSIIFSSEIDASSVNSSSVYIAELDPNSESTFSNIYPKGSSLDVKANEIIVTPYTYFNPNNEYRIVVTTGVKDINGRSLAQDYVYAFTTLVDSIDDGTSFTLESKRPSADSTVLVSTDIVLSFSKNLSSEPEYDGRKYFTVTDTNGTEIAGKTVVSNNLLKFIPNTSLPDNAQITVTLNNSVFDIYGYESLSLSTAWQFKTRDLNSTPKSSIGFKSLNSASIGKTAYLVRTIKNTNTESIIAVAKDGGIDIYKVKYPIPQSKPTFEYVSSYVLSSQVNAMVGFLDKYLLVGTISQGVKVFDITTNPISDVGDYNTTASIYGVKVSKNLNNVVDKAYAVGPAFGLQVYDINSSSGVLTPTVSQSPSVLGESLDVAATGVYDGTRTDTIVQKIYVVDYKGYLRILDENATLISSVDMKFSANKISVIGLYGVGLYLDVLSSSGIHEKINFDGDVVQGSLVDLTKSVNDMVSSLYYTYCAVGSNGVTTINDETYSTQSDYIEDLISTGGNAVSLDIVEGYNIEIPFLVTLNSDGLLQVFNGLHDDGGSSLSYNTPLNGTVELYFDDLYLDEATINKNSFSIKNNETGANVLFDIGKNTEGGFVLTPTNDLVADHNYSVTISPNISDMLGNKFNDGNETIINFKTAIQ